MWDLLIGFGFIVFWVILFLSSLFNVWLFFMVVFDVVFCVGNKGLFWIWFFVFLFLECLVFVLLECLWLLLFVFGGLFVVVIVLDFGLLFVVEFVFLELYFRMVFINFMK